MHDSVYRQHIVEHYKFPHNFGTLQNATHEAGHVNVSCGDQVRFQALIVRGKIRDIAFTGEGCSISMAASSMLSDVVKGKSFVQVKKMTKKDIGKMLGIPISGSRELCAMLGLSTVQRLAKISGRRVKKA